MEDKDVILARFQDFTKLENTEECIALLAQFNWDSEAALNYYLNFNHESSEGFPSPVNEHRFSNHDPFSAAYVSHFDSSAGSSPNIPSDVNLFNMPVYDHPSMHVLQPQQLHFTISQEDGATVHFTVLDTESVGTFRHRVSVETGVDLNEQLLTGWPTARHITDEDRLHDLNLPTEINLHLSRKLSYGEVSRPFCSSQFTFAIKSEDRTFLVVLGGDKTIRDLKTEIAGSLGVPLLQVLLSGWPSTVTGIFDHLKICDLGISPNTACNLTVSLSPATDKDESCQTSSAKERVASVDEDDDEMDEEDDDAYNDDIEVIEPDDHLPRRPQPLITEGLTDEQAAERFTAEFCRRYGNRRPQFFVGSLDRVIQDHLLCPASKRKLLAVYLHNDLSVMAHIFSENLLCLDTVVDILNTNFVTWAWDVTTEANKRRFMGMCTYTDLGRKVVNTMNSTEISDFPLLFIISRVRGVNQIIEVIKSNIRAEEFVSQLLHHTEEFRTQREIDAQEEWSREQKEREKMEQDQAYRDSLAADKAKEERRKKQEEESKRKEEEEQAEKRRMEEERLRIEKEKEALREEHSRNVPDEPSLDTTEQVSTIRIRCPDGKMLTRRFLANQPLQVLFSFLTSQGYHMTDYQLSQAYPHRDVTSLDHTKSFFELKLYPKEMLNLTHL